MSSPSERRRTEHLEGQIDRLSRFFLSTHPEWIGEGGAVDNAIFRMQELEAALAAERKRTERLEDVLVGRLKDVLAQLGYASALLARALRGWAQPKTGMGSNMLIEDKGLWQLALREFERVDPLVQAALGNAGEGGEP